MFYVFLLYFLERRDEFVVLPGIRGPSSEASQVVRREDGRNRTLLQKREIS